MNDRKTAVFTVVLCGLLLLALTAACWFGPDQALSQTERRPLTQRPQLTWAAVLDGSYMEQFETYTQDQFPLRERFRRLRAVTATAVLRQRDTNGLYRAEGHLSKLDAPLDDAMLDYAAGLFNRLCETNLAGMPVYFAVVPDKNCYLAEANGYPALDYAALLAGMEARMPQATHIDLTGQLTLEDYYTTDSHWKQENLEPVARYLADAMGVQLTDAYTVGTVDAPFYGVYYGQSALPAEPDALRYLTSDLLADCTVTSYASGAPEAAEVYDLSKAAGRDPYDLFLGGADPLIVIENPNAATDRELLLFRDSYGSSLAPLLVSSYAKVTLIDLRYMQSQYLSSLVEFDPARQEALFLYSSALLNNSLALH